MMLVPNKEWRHKIREEQRCYDTSLKARILRQESFYMGQYLKWMRTIEWYDAHKCLIYNIFGGGRVICHFMLRHYGRKTGFQVPPHTCDFGVRFYHWGWCIINKNARVGKNATLYPGVTIGQTADGQVPTCGDNVFFGLSCKVLGGVKIGNNVTIAPNAVVTKDVPDNCVVSGVPAKIIKYIETDDNKHKNLCKTRK